MGSGLIGPEQVVQALKSPKLAAPLDMLEMLSCILDLEVTRSRSAQGCYCMFLECGCNGGTPAPLCGDQTRLVGGFQLDIYGSLKGLEQASNWVKVRINDRRCSGQHSCLVPRQRKRLAPNRHWLKGIKIFELSINCGMVRKVGRIYMDRLQERNKLRTYPHMVNDPPFVGCRFNGSAPFGMGVGL